MKMIWSGSPMDFVKSPAGLPKMKVPDMFSPRSVFQACIMFFSFAQSLIQPVQNAYHLYKIDKNILDNGQKVIRLQELYQGLQKEFIQLKIPFRYRNSLKDLNMDPRRAIHLLIEEPERFQIALREIAEFEILWRIASSPLLSESSIVRYGNYPLVKASGI